MRVPKATRIVEKVIGNPAINTSEIAIKDKDDKEDGQPRKTQPKGDSQGSIDRSTLFPAGQLVEDENRVVGKVIKLWKP